MNVQSILAVTDLGWPGCAALRRAWELAERHGAELRLLRLGDGRAAGRLAPAPHPRREMHGVALRTVARTSHGLQDLAREARAVDLVVAPHRARRSLAALWLGDPVQRTVRAIPRPLLLVKRVPLAPYRRVLVAVGLGRSSQRLLRAATLVTPDAELELFHAIDTHVEGRMRLAQASEAALRHHRDSRRRDAEARLAQLAAAARLASWRVKVAVDFGDPASRAVLQQCSSRADLLAVGGGEPSWCGGLLFGSVAQRVASWAHGDVLVVPHADLPCTSRQARARLREEAARIRHAPPVPELERG